MFANDNNMFLRPASEGRPFASIACSKKRKEATVVIPGVLPGGCKQRAKFSDFGRISEFIDVLSLLDWSMAAPLKC